MAATTSNAAATSIEEEVEANVISTSKQRKQRLGRPSLDPAPQAGLYLGTVIASGLIVGALSENRPAVAAIAPALFLWVALGSQVLFGTLVLFLDSPATGAWQRVGAWFAGWFSGIGLALILFQLGHTTDLVCATSIVVLPCTFVTLWMLQVPLNATIGSGNADHVWNVALGLTQSYFVVMPWIVVLAR